MRPILEVTDLWKKYQIGANQAPYLSLREKLTQTLRSTPKENFWALKGVNFSVEEGESLGIIGRNGAGKSTLLKILSRITPPTKGYVRARGRVASLLEVGTGFHPELTGRENVYLNGSILGLKRREIASKFDAIVDFSGVEQFLDTALKHYSSGMRLRLAFSVAAHLEPEILMIDEVLAVGDAEFQKKCLGKMDEVSRSGRTVLFVSHHLGMIAQLSQKVIVLDHGRLLFQGNVAEGFDLYQKLDETLNQQTIQNRTIDIIAFKNIALLNAEGVATSNFFHFEPIFIALDFQVKEWNEHAELSVSLYNNLKQRVFTIIEPLQNFLSPNPSQQRIYLRFPPHFIMPSHYSWHFAIILHNVKNFDLMDDVLPFRVVDGGSPFARYEGSPIGNIFPQYKIQTILE